MTKAYDYTNDAAAPEAIHLREQDPAVTTTLCGRTVDSGWVMGDETVSAVAATCRPCLDEFHNERGRELQGGGDR